MSTPSTSRPSTFTPGSTLTTSAAGYIRASAKTLRLADLSLLCVAVGVFLRVRLWWSDATLWADEQMIALNFRDRSFWEMAGYLDMHQNAPLGWLQLEWLIGHGVGFGERTLRVIPLVFGVTALFMAWWIARRWFNAAGAVVFVGLCAIGPHLVYYSAEVKPYALDVFLVLGMMALAAATLDRLRTGTSSSDDTDTTPPELSPRAGRRLLWPWWIVASVAGWFSLAAVQLAVPVSLLLLAFIWHRHGRRTALHSLAPGAVWLVAFLLHFALAIRYTIGDAWLENAWRYAYAPQPYTVGGFSDWLVGIAPGIAFKPVGIYGSGYAVIFWLLVALGVAAIAKHRKDLALLVMAPLITVVALAVLRIAPPVDRVVLWIVPALFIAIAAACQAVVTWSLRQGQLLAATQTNLRWRHTIELVTVIVATVGALGAVGLFVARPMVNQVSQTPQWWQSSSDDRAAVQWLQRHHKPGDMVLVPFLSRFAVSWYANSRQWDSEPESLAPVQLLHYSRPGSYCDPTELQRTLVDQRRVLLFTGSPFFPGLTELAASRLKQLGRLERTQTFGREGAVRVYDLAQTPSLGPSPAASSPDAAAFARPDNCLKVLPYDNPY